MPLQPGTTLGPYEVTAKLGEGGMGEVWRATDTKLNRDVALKILPEAFATDPDRLARFQREAQVLASLNHPNIAQIHGIEEQDDTRALVLELVEGPTLADRISKGPIPLDEALPIAKQIAEALEAAHEAGVIHRDLKPANIKVRDDGTVKVLDFGLAKALDPSPTGDPSQSPTLTAAATQMGVIMGTAAYMSPEQARGKPVDRRTDIWSFGCVLYEMLAGKKTFDGTDITETIARVVEREPDWDALPSGVSPVLDSFLRRCFAKEPKQRLRDVGDLRLAMEGVFDIRGAEQEISTGSGSRVLLTRSTVWASLATLIVGSVGTALVLDTTSGTSDQVAYVILNVDPINRLGDTGGVVYASPILSRTTIALSPDGTRVVLAGWQDGEQSLFVRALDRPETTPIPGTEEALNPFFSPDGEWVGFWANGQLHKVALSGGLPVPLCETTVIYGASWTTEDRIVFAQGSGGLWTVSAEGGLPELFTQPRGEGGTMHRLPWALPSGAVLFTEMVAGNRADAEVVVEVPGNGTRRVLVEGATNPIYAPSGHLLFVRSGVLWAVPFDVTALEITGPEVPVLEDIMQAIGLPNVSLNTGAAQLSLSASGTLAFLPGGVVEPERRRVVSVNRRGQADPLDFPLSTYWTPRVSPDGRYIAVADAVAGNVIVLDRRRNVVQRLPGNGLSVGAWTPDGDRVFTSWSEGTRPPNLFWQYADGSALPERIATAQDLQFAGSATPTGELIYVERREQTGADILVIDPFEPDSGITPVIAGPSADAYPALSPDGRWLAYASNESGVFEVFVVAYPEPDRKYQVSSGGGLMPVWSSNGEELFYVRRRTGQDASVMEVLVSGDSEFEAQSPHELFSFPLQFSGFTRSYDVTPDGHFVMVERDLSPRSLADTSPRIILDWLSELERLVPTN